MPAPRFKNFIRRADRNTILTGAHRCGLHGNLKSLLDPTSDEAARVAVDMPGIMIKTIKYVITKKEELPRKEMGAKAHALYEFLMASARLDLVEETSFTVPFADVKKFLGVERTDRIRDYIDALSTTWVSYHFTEKDGVESMGRKIQLLQCAEKVMPNGERHIGYSMHPDIRTVILRARSYTWKELAAFAKFTCKYSPRLYPMLAYRAGMNFEQPAPLIMGIEELAGQLGWSYEPGKFKFSHFEARCLKPALADIAAHVTRFRVLEYSSIHGDTRGLPVIKVSFTVSQAHRPLEQRQKAETTATEKRILQALMAQRGLSMQTEVPAMDTLARAATVLETTTINVARRWAEVLERAREVPQLPFGRKDKGIGQDILDLLQTKGVGAAFGLWLTDPEPFDPLTTSGTADADDQIEGVEQILEDALTSRHIDLSDYLNSLLAAS